MNAFANSQEPNLEAMGMGYYSPGQNAFQACVPRSIIAGEHKPPKKRGAKSKLQQSIDAVSSFEERQAAKQRAQLKAKATRVSKYTERATPAQAQAANDKTRQIQASSNRYRTA